MELDEIVLFPYSDTHYGTYLLATPDHILTAGLDQVGYGDVSPESDVGKILFIIFILFGLSLVGFAMGVVVSKVANLTGRDPTVLYP